VPIAVASDQAFCFYYPDNLELLRNAGAQIKNFSPIRDRRLPAGVKGIYLGGGYPELHARQLAHNRPLRAAIREFIEAGGPVYAECGGLMYLAAALTDCVERQYPMVGAYPFKTRMLPRLRALGYREVLIRNKTFGAPSEKVRGHEFHYSEIYGSSSSRKVDTAYLVKGMHKTMSCQGFRYKNCLASYVHLHFGSNPEFARSFVAACRGKQTLLTERYKSPNG
jgi:cobyrinic acid a,c-diamide synthase